MKKIKFIPTDSVLHFKVDPPQPATKFVPDWYRKGEMYISAETLELPMKGEKKSGGLKSCIPFLDAMISGYMLTTWHALEITKNSNNVIEWNYVLEYDSGKYEDLAEELIIPLINERKGAIGHTIPRPAGHAINHFAWNGQWGMRTPRGWSMMVTHPHNRYDLPFTTVSGFMDSDKFWANGNIPFFLKDGWTGVIPQGTPFAQLIPVQRNSWISNISTSSKDYSEYVASETRKVPYHYYRDKLWQKKEYK